MNFLILSFGLFSIILFLFSLLRERRLLCRLQTMLDDAIDGTFEEKHLDESRLSVLESSMWRYLHSQQVSYQKLSEQQQQLQQQISDISHQALTPLSNILLYAQLLEEQATAPQSVSLEEITAIQEQAEKLDFFLQALVKLSRLETGIISLQVKKQEITEVLFALKHQFFPKAAAKNIRLTIPSSSAFAVFDRKWTIEALANLLDNAIKYTSEGGAVSVQITEYLLFLRIDVIDTGIGIPERDLGSIFTRFYRSSEVSEQPGIGLGLYVAREVMKAQKGYIKVSSHPGAGSTFSAFLLRQSNEISQH